LRAEWRAGKRQPAECIADEGMMEIGATPSHAAGRA
jgi:hypothetical protein